MATATMTKGKALAQAKRAARLLREAVERHETAIRAAADLASRTEIAEAVGLSRTRVQQIIHGTNR